MTISIRAHMQLHRDGTGTAQGRHKRRRRCTPGRGTRAGASRCVRRRTACRLSGGCVAGDARRGGAARERAAAAGSEAWRRAKPETGRRRTHSLACKSSPCVDISVGPWYFTLSTFELRHRRVSHMLGSCGHISSQFSAVPSLPAGCTELYWMVFFGNHSYHALARAAGGKRDEG